MGVNRKNTPSVDIEVENFEMFRVVQDNTFHAHGVEFPGFIKLNFFHFAFLCVNFSEKKEYSGTSRVYRLKMFVPEFFSFYHNVACWR